MKLKYLILTLLAIGTAPIQAQQTTQSREDLQQRVNILERQVSSLSDMVLRLDTLTREMQQLRGEVELQNHSMDALKERQRDLYLDLDKRITDLNSKAATTMNNGSFTPSQSTPAATGRMYSSAPVESISTSGNSNASFQTVPGDLPPGDPAQEDERYRAAFSMLREGKYAEAGTALISFLAQYPNSSKADNAQYWLAEAAYTTKDLPAALTGFTALIQNYPQSAKISDAMLKSGYIYYDNQQYPQAREILQKVIKDHSGSTPARLAQKQLDRMDREGH